MKLFKKNKQDKKTYATNEIYVLTTTITSNYDDGSHNGPICVTWYFLATKKDDFYYELFSEKKIEKETDMHSDGVVSLTFNVPYIERVEPITQYLVDSSKKELDKVLLFDFITNMNVLNHLGAFEEISEE